jgi:cytochrome c oxidase cbb3-type subunit I/II
MMDPTSMSPGSLMPPYPSMLDNKLDLSTLPSKIKALRTLGTPYPADYEGTAAVDDAKDQAQKVAKNLKELGVKESGLEDKEIVAIIAYLQRLGTDIKVDKPATSK